MESSVSNPGSSNSGVRMEHGFRVFSGMGKHRAESDGWGRRKGF